MAGPARAPAAVVLAGGVGGSKLVAGLARLLPPDRLVIVVNTADDFRHLGLAISPDLDTVMHRLAGVHDPERGWGRADESWAVMAGVAALGGPDWFRLGDRDLATHLVRTGRLEAGASLTTVTAELCRALGTAHVVRPMSDDRVATEVRTDAGWSGFQEWFVGQAAGPEVHQVHFRGATRARAGPGLADAVTRAEVLVVAPSNPFLSIDPIRAVPDLGAALAARAPGRRTVAVSPIVAGRALRGPAARLLARFGRSVDAVGVAAHLSDILTDFVVDRADAHQADEVRALGLRPHVLDTVMRDPAAETRLAMQVLAAVAGDDP